MHLGLGSPLCYLAKVGGKTLLYIVVLRGLVDSLLQYLFALDRRFPEKFPLYYGHSVHLINASPDPEQHH